MKGLLSYADMGRLFGIPAETVAKWAKFYNLYREEDRVDISEFLWLFDMFQSLLPDELEAVKEKGG